MRALVALKITFAALALTAAFTPTAQAQGRCGDTVTYFDPVSLGPGQKARLRAFNPAPPDPVDPKAGSAAVTLKFELYRPGAQAGGQLSTHVAAGERSSAESLTLPPGQALTLGFTDSGADTWTVRAVVLGYSSLPGGSAAPLRLTLEIIDAATGQTNSILIDGADTWCRWR